MSSSDAQSSENKYAVLMETNGKEFESWLYFIKYNGNEKALEKLQKELERVEFYILDDLSTFDLDLEHLVSEQTAKEMTKVELNSVMFHRKFDGTLEDIDFGFKKADNNDKRIVRVFKKIGIGMIADYIDDEDIDEEDLSSCSDDSSSDGTDYEYGVSTSSDESSSSSEEEDTRPRKQKKKDFKEMSVKEKLAELKIGKKRH